MSCWVKVRKKRINLDYTILVEEHDDTPETSDLAPGGLRLTVETGRVLVFPPGADVERLLRTIDDAITGPAGTEPRAAPGPGGAAVAAPLDPRTGEPLPRKSVKGG